MTRRTRELGRPLLVLAAVLSVAAALLTAGLQSASGAVSAPASIEVTAVTSTFQPPAGTPARAVPYGLVAKAVPFTVQVRFLDATGAPAAFNKDTRLVLTANTGPGNKPVEIDWTALKDAQTADLRTRLDATANQVVITVTGPARGATPAPTGRSGAFDVLSLIRSVDSTPSLRQGIGGGDGLCSSATPADPVCGVAILPNGAVSDSVLLSLGPCDTTAYANCGSSKGLVVQLLADLDEVRTRPDGTEEIVDLYSRTAPATILVRCDKTLCGGKSIQATTLNFTSGGNAGLLPAGPCPAKNTIGNDPVCVDYVQSTRDNAGDSLLYLLFTKDARVSVR